MKSTIRLFKALPITDKKKKQSKPLLKKTISKGFIFSPEVIHNYSEKELIRLISIIDKEIGLTPEQTNSSFHKSWKKIREADIEQLVIEQLFHYLTTYGFEARGIYDKDFVYIPNEKLELPDSEGTTLTVIRGYTKTELKEKIMSLLQAGIALNEDTINDIVDIALFVGIDDSDISSIKNKETKTILYDYLDLFPGNPIEFLRYVVYKSTDRTLLIKDGATLEAIKNSRNITALKLFNKYKIKYGLERLAGIFYRFKPIFLAFKTNSGLCTIINKTRKLAIKHHMPMPEDYLNAITAKIKNKEVIDIDKLKVMLVSATIFRKIRLAYALKFRTKNTEAILYRIRNGKGYATGFQFDNKKKAREVLNIVLDSIVADIKIKDKKIYIPEHVVYTLPATEKQFTGNYPSGTYISIPRDMIVGIHWENIKGRRIDLDLSMINQNGKIGWDGGYRTEDRTVLFSGDVTDAPNGASELFYVEKQKMDSYILFVNYYNHDNSIEVPFKIIVAKEKTRNFQQNYMVNPDNILSIAKTKITQKQKVLGLLTVTTKECRFYFTETNLGKSISAGNNVFVENSKKYLFDFYRNTISLKDILMKAGNQIVRDKRKCDIDLSPENLEKSTIIDLLQ
jgi:hypothetical protein